MHVWCKVGWLVLRLVLIVVAYVDWRRRRRRRNTTYAGDQSVLAALWFVSAKILVQA